MYYLEPDVAALLSLASNIVIWQLAVLWPKKRFLQRAPLKNKTFVELLTPRNCKQGQLRLFLVTLYKSVCG